MKENLVQKLDLLEVQLAKIEGRDDNLAKLNRTKHLLERWEKSGNLPSSRSELAQQISDTKKELAARKKYYAESSIKKILKQFVKVEPLRIAKRKKAQEGNADKLANLDQELALVNNMDTDVWSREVVERFMSKKFVVSYEKRHLNQVEISLFARIGKMDAVKKALTQLEQSLVAYLPQSEAAIQSKDPQPSDESRDRSVATEKAAVDTKVVNPQPAKADDFADFGDEDNEKQAQASEGSEDEETDPFFEEHVGLPQLREGYVSGSDDESDIEEPEKPARRNRRGQRARRKIWEQKFGTKANHVIKEEQKEQEKQREKALKKRKRDEKQQQFKRQKLEFESKPIHPSWEAKQKLKEQQRSASFKGKKIQFD